MARVGNNNNNNKLAFTKLKSAIKRFPSFTKFSSNNNNNHRNNSPAIDDIKSESGPSIAVFVGKSRRRYDVAVDVASHRLFRELVERSELEEEGVHVADCEVVMFEHLLWMIHNNSVDEDLVHYYTTSSSSL